MPTWPNTLPAPLADACRETAANTVVRSDMEQGPAKTRQRTTAGVSRLSLGYLMSASQISDLQDFFETDLIGGALGFGFTHPRTGDTVTARFRQPPEYASANGGYFRASIELEVLP